MSEVCKTCGGAIQPPGAVWGYAGPICLCLYAAASAAPPIKDFRDERIAALEAELAEAKKDAAHWKHAVWLARDYLHGGGGVEDQGQAWDCALRVLDAAMGEKK